MAEVLMVVETMTTSPFSLHFHVRFALNQKKKTKRKTKPERITVWAAQISIAYFCSDQHCPRGAESSLQNQREKVVVRLNIERIVTSAARPRKQKHLSSRNVFRRKLTWPPSNALACWGGLESARLWRVESDQGR